MADVRSWRVAEMGDSSKIVETDTYQYEANTIIAEGIIEGAINKTSLEEIGKHENIDENSDVQVTHTKKAEEDAYQIHLSRVRLLSPKSTLQGG